MNYDANEMFQGAAALAAIGMKVVKLYGVRDDGTCTCRKGAACPSAGKHPAMGEAWHAQATDDEEEISLWFHDTNENIRWNIGVRLGRVSGIIDVEADDAEALEVMKRYGLDRIDTVAYRGSRGPHYLFQFDPDLPDTAVVHVGALEVRLGGGEMAAQSVFPKSWHKSGNQYQWLPGRSPDDVNIAVLPEAFKQAIITNSKAKGSGVIAQSREALAADRQIKEGGRHAWLVGMASKHAQRVREYTEAERSELINMLRALNSAYCVPPKTDEEVRKVANDQFDHYAQRRVERRARRPLERFGLRWDEEAREYEPGEWHLTVVHSDPKMFRLRVPSLTQGEGQLLISLNSDQFVTAKSVQKAILDASGKMDVADPNSNRWNSVWLGESVQDEQGERRNIRGLKSKLLEQSDDEFPAAETKNYTYLASILLSYLRQFDAIDDETEESSLPNLSGVPKRIKVNGRLELWFKWRETWSQATRKLPKGELGYKDSLTLRSRILEVTGQKEFADTLKTVNGERSRWIVWTDREIKALEKLSGG